MLQDAYVVDACRTPIGRHGGALASVRPDDLLALVLRALLQRNPTLDPAAVEDVLSGAANQAGEDNRNVARMAALLAGLPASVPGATVNRLCASGLEAVAQAARAIRCGEGEVYLAGGVESMTRAPYVLGKADAAFGRGQELFDTTIGWRFVNPKLAELHHPYAMGETAENVAERYGIRRQEQDDFAYSSQQKYAAAEAVGKFAEERIPVPVAGRKGAVTQVTTDENPRPDVTLEALAALKPVFRAGGSVTAGNSSGINDGAAAVLLASEGAVKQYNLQPMARIVGAAAAGVDPAVMGIGPVPATQKVLSRAGLRMEEIGLVELNEAFAAQSIACIRDLRIDPMRVNVNGGAIALGHPLGCSGARILGTLVHEMRRQGTRYGIATMCVGVGQGLSVLVERV